MVYESDFYTTRRPYRSTPQYSTYTVSSAPSRQVRILPGLGKVHIVHTYDRIVPYVGHKRLSVVTLPPKVYSTRPSVLHREYDWIENKLRPWVGYSATNRYLDSDSSVRYVYVRNPITGLKYHSEYLPSRYYNFYRIIRPLSSYDDYWPYYRPLSHYYNYWPSYRTLSYLDDIPIYRSLRLQRKYDTLAGLYYPYYDKWCNYYRYSRPLSLYNRSFWSDYLYDTYYRTGYLSQLYNDIDYQSWRYSKPLDRWYPKRSYYWLKYLPVSYTYRFIPRYSYSDLYESIFDDETRSIKAQTASLLKQIHLPVPRIRNWSVAPLNRYGVSSSLPSKYSNDVYIHKLLTVSPTSKVEYATYYTEPVKKYIGRGHLSCVSYAGDKSYSRRRPLTFYEDALRNDIQLLSYYITRFRQEKTEPKEIKVPLSASRPSRIFSAHKPIDNSVTQEISELREARAARLAKIYETDKQSTDVENSQTAKRKEETKLAEEKSLAEEQASKKAKKEAERKAEVARQEELAANAAAERASELERLAEQKRQEELAKQAEIAKARQLEEERARQEEQRRLEEEAKAEEERKQLLRLEELARQAEEEKEAELARQAEELAELARQEAELAELERQERELKEQAAREAELEELARQEAELAELERQEKELAELAEQSKREAELARQEAELEELAKQQAELAALEKQEAELEEQEKQEEEVVEPASEQIEVDEQTQDDELAELARQEAELAELEAQLASTNQESAPSEPEAQENNDSATAEPTVEEPLDENPADE